MRTAHEISSAVQALKLAIVLNTAHGEHGCAMHKAALLLALDWALGAECEYLNDVSKLMRQMKAEAVARN